MARERDKYVVVMFKGDKLIRESPKMPHEYRSSNWVRNQDEWYAAKKRDPSNAHKGIWTADDYTFRVVKISA